MKIIRIYISLLVMLAACPLYAQVNLTNKGTEILVKEGTEFSIKGNLNNLDSVVYNLGIIKITGDIINQAHHLFPEDNAGKIVLNGDSVQLIKGNGKDVYFHILSLNNGDTLKLELPILLYDSLFLQNGNLFLNGNNVVLDNASNINATGFLFNENDNNKIFGDTGYLVVQYLAFQPVQQNVAGIGLEMNTSGNFGATTIKRFHQQQSIMDGSINKVYDFDFANTANSDIQISYFNSDFNSSLLTESEFVLWKSIDNGINYTNIVDSLNETNNTYDAFGILMEDSWLTLAPRNCKVVPEVNIGGDTTRICKGDTALLIAGDKSENMSYYWNDGSTDSSLTATSEGWKWVRKTNAKGCFAFDSTYVKFHHQPLASFTTANVCMQDSAKFINSSTINFGNIIQNRWVFGDGDSLFQIEPAHLYSTHSSFSVQLQVKSDSGCYDDTIRNITIHPHPQAGFSDTYLCDNLEISYQDTSAIAASYAIMNRTWDFDNGLSSHNSDTTIQYATDGSYTVQLLVESNAGCKDSISKILQLFPNDTASFTATDECHSDTTLFTNTSSFGNSGISYAWSFDDGSNSILENPQHPFSNTGIHNTQLIVFYNNGQCSDTMQNSHEVFTRPYLNMGGTASNCDSYTMDALNPGCTYIWDDNSTAQTRTVQASGLYYVSITSSNGCSYTDSLQVTIHYSPQPNLGNDTAHCAFFDLDAGYSGSTYSWNIGATSQQYQVLSSGLYSVTVSDGFGCIGSDSIQVNIYAVPVANFSVNDVCLNQISQFADNSTITSGVINTFTWNFDNLSASSSQNPTYQFPNDYLYTIQLKVISDMGCVDSITKSTQIRPLPQPGYTDSYTCDKQQITFNDTSAASPGYTISSLQWDFGNGQQSNLSNPEILFTSAGNYSVKQIVTNSFGCMDSITKGISVDATDTLSFNAPSICLNDTTYYTNSSSYSEPNLQWSWNLGDNSLSSGRHVSHVYSGFGVYNTSLVVNYHNGQCYDTLNKHVEVYNSPYISFGDTIQTCGTNYILNAQNSGSSYFWSDNSANQEITVYSNGNYKVLITDTNGCSFSDSVYVSLLNPLLINLGNDTTVCGFIYLELGYSGSDFLWNTGDTTQIIKVDSSAIYNVKVTDQNGCDGYDTISVSINPLPLASFTTMNACAADSIQFTNLSSISNGSITNYLFDFGDGNNSTIANTKHAYQNSGSYQINLRVTSDLGCEKDTNIQLSIYDLPNAGFATSTLCNNFEVSFDDTSSIANSSSIQSYQWDFDNSHYSHTADTTIIYADTGTYNVKLTVNSIHGCTDSVVHNIQVVDNDSAFFFAANNCFGDTSYFNNVSWINGSAQYNWKFSSTDSSQNVNAKHWYTASGSYQVDLIAKYNNLLCTDTFSKQIEIYNNPTLAFPDSVKTCLSNYLLDAQNPGSSYIWSNFSTNQSLQVSNDGTYWVEVTDTNGCLSSDTTVFTFLPVPNPNLGADTSECGLFNLDAGLGNSYTWNTGDSLQLLTVNATGLYSVSVSNPEGCVGKDSIQVQIYPLPTVNLPGNIDTCNVDSLWLDAGNFTSYVWNTGAYSQNIAATQTGIYSVTVSDINNCQDSDSTNINMYFLDAIQLSDSLFICPGENLVVNPEISNASLIWTGPNAYYQTTDSVTIQTTGLYHIEASILSCVEKDSFIVAVSNKAITTQFLMPSDVIVNDSVKFIELSYPDPISFQWNFGDGVTDTLQDPVHVYYVADTFFVVLSSANTKCASQLSKRIIVKPIVKDTITEPGKIIPYNSKDLDFAKILNTNLYPNPNNGIFTVDVELSGQTDMLLGVYDVSGKLIFMKKYTKKEDLSENFNIQNLSAGVYFIVIQTNHERKTFKMVRTK